MTYPTQEPKTLVDILRRRALRQPNQIAYTFLADGETEGPRLSYGALDEASRAVAAYLQEHDGEGRRVLLLLEGGPRFLEAFFGCLYAGAVAVPAHSPAEGLARLGAIASDCGVDFVITDDTLPEDARALLESAAQWCSGGNNVGLVMPPGLVALDADSQPAAAWCDAALPDAPMQETARGAHFIVRVPANCRIKSTVKVPLAPGVEVDVRSGGQAQIVVEPSIHETGAVYSWKRLLPKAIEDVPECPPGICEAIV